MGCGDGRENVLVNQLAENLSLCVANEANCFRGCVVVLARNVELWREICVARFD